MLELKKKILLKKKMGVIHTYINLDDCEVPESSSKPKSWVDGLTTNDKEILTKGGVA